jgi:hypothetical protein
MTTSRYTRVAALAADLERELERSERPAMRGQLEGLTSHEPAPLAGRGGEGSDVERGGYLTGRLFRWLLDDQIALDAQLMMAAAVYAANVAQSGSLPRSGEALVKEHTVACLRIARRGHALDEDIELLMFGWLAAEGGVVVTDAVLARQHTMRERRRAAGTSSTRSPPHGDR